MAISGASTSTTVSTAIPVMAWSVRRRFQLTGGIPSRMDALVSSGMSPRRLATCHRPHQQLRECVYDDRDQEERQTDLDQSRQINVARGLAELIGEDTGHGVAGREQRFRYLWPIPDDHGDSHGFTERSA